MPLNRKTIKYLDSDNDVTRPKNILLIINEAFFWKNIGFTD